MKVREVQFYTDKVGEGEVRNIFGQIVKAKVPILGFLDLSAIFSFNFAEFVIKRKANTLTFFIRDKPNLQNIAHLMFPYKLIEPSEIERMKGSLSPKFYILGGEQDFISFMLKGNVEELHLSVSQIFGTMIALGSTTDSKGIKRPIIVTNPAKFLRSDLEKNPSIYLEIIEPLPKQVALTSSYPVFEESGGSVGVDNYDPFQHTLTLGASGTGKSKFLFIIIKALEARYGNNIRIVILDPHGEFIHMFPKRKIVNFIENYIEPLDISGQKTPLMAQLITQLVTASIGEENKYAERVIYYVVNLLIESNNLTLTNINAVLTDPSKRAEFTSLCPNAEVKRFFDQEYNDIYIHNFNAAVLPVLNFIGEYELHLGGERKRETLLDLIRRNRIVVVSFNPQFFGHTMVKFLAGAVINQLYILALTENFKIPTILVIDELPRIEIPVVKDILAETRKFNLYAYLSSQYLAQLRKDLINGIISNIRNIVAFKLNRDDAALISSITEIKVEEYFKKHRSQTEIEESKREMFVRLHQRECIVRLFDGQKYLIPMKFKVVDVDNWKEEGAVFPTEEFIAEAGEEEKEETGREIGKEEEKEGQPIKKEGFDKKLLAEDKPLRKKGKGR